jgi:hypothetical protein
MRHRTTATDADGVFGNYQCRRKLSSFEFVGGRFNFIEQIINQARVAALVYNFFGREFAFKITLQNYVHQIVWRQTVLIELIRREFGGRRFVNNLVSV